MNERSQHWKRRREPTRCRKECFKVAFLDGQLSVFKFEPPAHLHMFWTLEDDGWNNESVILVMRIPNFQVKKHGETIAHDVASSYQYQSRFNREACSRLAEKSPKHGAIFWHFTSRVKKSVQMKVKIFLSRDCFSAKKIKQNQHADKTHLEK